MGLPHLEGVELEGVGRVGNLTTGTFLGLKIGLEEFSDQERSVGVEVGLEFCLDWILDLVLLSRLLGTSEPGLIQLVLLELRLWVATDGPKNMTWLRLMMDGQNRVGGEHVILRAVEDLSTVEPIVEHFELRTSSLGEDMHDSLVIE